MARGLRVGAVQHGRRVVAAVERRPQPAHNEVGFFQLVPGAVHHNLLTGRPVRPQPLLLAAAVAADHAPRGVQDHLRGTVVAFQAHHGGVGEVLLEIQDVADVGAAPLVDGLVRVAHHAQVAVRRKLPDQLVLRAVRVLVLVHHDVAELCAVAPPRRFRRVEQRHRLQQQVVEIQGVGAGERPPRSARRRARAARPGTHARWRRGRRRPPCGSWPR